MEVAVFEAAFSGLRCLRRTIPIAIILGILLADSQGATSPENQPVAGPGATKEEVLRAYGWPNGQSQSGTKEILTYPQGLITLDQGRVVRVDFSPKIPWPAPKPRPAGASATSAKRPDPSADIWTTSLTEAINEATLRKASILALFTGSDWSPPSRQFQSEVALHPEFIDEFIGGFVFLKLDFPTHTEQPESLRTQNAALRERFHVSTYPSLLVLSASGALLTRVDLGKVRPEDSYRGKVVAALREARDGLAKPPLQPQKSSDATDGVTSLNWTAWLVPGAIGLVLILLTVLWWSRRSARNGL